ncbi:hypothetical protein ElyMa_002363500 [Elysia marginata]|uniref:Hepcidin n=1 Tax=Elysia marginata TaxID=1093978 RepID=A0AAV4GAW2_9GAST|nr:hypothetical protein ElyMa_002363500 [Elysia marginata]
MAAVRVVLVMLSTVVVSTVALPGMATYQHPVQPKHLGHVSSSVLSSPSSSSPQLYPQFRPDAVSTPERSTVLREKRVSRIACTCCSNSFNSHCCLRCMQR